MAAEARLLFYSVMQNAEGGRLLLLSLLLSFGVTSTQKLARDIFNFQFRFSRMQIFRFGGNTNTRRYVSLKRKSSEDKGDFVSLSRMKGRFKL